MPAMLPTEVCSVRALSARAAIKAVEVSSRFLSTVKERFARIGVSFECKFMRNSEANN